MKEVGHDTVKSLMRLARLALPPEEALRVGGDLGRLLEYVDQLASVEVGPVSQEAPAGGGAPRLRDDVARPGLPRSVATSGVAHAPAGLFSVPKVIPQTGQGARPAPPEELDA